MNNLSDFANFGELKNFGGVGGRQEGGAGEGGAKGKSSPRVPKTLATPLGSVTISRLYSITLFSDPVKFPFLDRLYIDPPVNFKPNLNLSEVMEYYATVPYETIVIAIQGVAKHCYAEARLTDKHGSSRSLCEIFLNLMFTKV